MNTHGILGTREKALEYEFFHRVDQSLLEQMREGMEQEAERQDLSACTGIEDAQVLDELIRVGIRAETALAMSLVPLVDVAWADGKMETKERKATLKAAEEQGYGPGTPGGQLLEAWLESPPPASLDQVWMEYVAAVRQVLAPEAFRKLGEDILRHARDVAEAAGGFLGIKRVSSEEEAVLKKLESVFAGNAPESAGD